MARYRINILRTSSKEWQGCVSYVPILSLLSLKLCEIQQRLNHSLEGLEGAVIAHPYRTGFFFIGLLGAFIMFVKRFVADDSPSDYHRVHKSSKGLD